MRCAMCKSSNVVAGYIWCQACLTLMGLRPKDEEPNDVVIVDYDYCIAVMDKAIEDSLNEESSE